MLMRSLFRSRSSWHMKNMSSKTSHSYMCASLWKIIRSSHGHCRAFAADTWWGNKPSPDMYAYVLVYANLCLQVCSWLCSQPVLHASLDTCCGTSVKGHSNICKGVKGVKQWPTIPQSEAGVPNLDSLSIPSQPASRNYPSRTPWHLPALQRCEGLPSAKED